ncbi:hypothetical protein [Streptomyces sp. NPDC047028]|uniref:hypothetical protein n=1 Tax=Streptomyces sp. NPDC047028 TaxID=3155793 RepID=UPI0033D82A55
MAATIALGGVAGMAPAHAVQTSQVHCEEGDSLQDAIDNALSGSTLTITGTCRGTFTIGGKDLNLQGEPLAVLDGYSHPGTVITITSGEVQLSNLVIKNGNTQNTRFKGGGINVNDDASLTLSASRITGNAAVSEEGGGGEGGGIYNEGSLTVTRSLITGNTAESGGGIYSLGGQVTLQNSRIARNTARFSGGGIESVGGGSGSLKLTASQVANNNARGGDGGGIDNNGGSSLTLTSSTISRNTASDNGGGINNSTSDFSVHGSLIALNHARTGNGGGINTTDSDVKVMMSSLIALNLAVNGRGGGINNNSSLPGSGTVALSASQVIGNRPDNCFSVANCPNP